MIYLNILGEHYIILSSLEVVTDLLEKRSSNYSDRKHMTMVNELYVPHSFSQRIPQSLRYRSMQNELEYEHVIDAIRLVVAKTQEIISRVFLP